MRVVSAAAFAVAMLFVALVSSAAMAAPAPAPTTAVQVQKLAPVGGDAAAVKFDPDKAIAAYLATVSGEARARSDAYYEGQAEWLPAVDAVYAIVVAALLLFLRVSARMRNIAQRMTRSRFFQVPIYVAMFLVLTTVVTFPLTVYEGFIREHAYGLSNMSFMEWFGDFGIEFALTLGLGIVILTFIYAAIRGAGRSWWVWGWLITMAFFVVLQIIGPVFISPLFNKYYPLPAGPEKTEILTLARANGIPVTNVYEFNASRQSKRISANVSGFMGTTRISMTDNLINRSSPREVYAVLGHEMGHYVLDHGFIGLTWVGFVFLVGFGFVSWGFRFLTGLFGGNWEVRAIDDPAGLPVLWALLMFFLLVMTPVLNTITRTTERQADIFGLNAARQPDGFATSALKLAEYRKLDPSPLEEIIFYDHPSGRSRITMAMRWKAAHINDPDIKAGPVSPQ